MLFLRCLFFHTSYQRTNSFYKCTLFLRSLFWCPSLCLPISKEQRHLALFISLVIKINTLYIIIRIRVFIFILSLSTDLYRLEWISLISFFLIIYIKLVKISSLSITSLKRNSYPYSSIFDEVFNAWLIKFTLSENKDCKTKCLTLKTLSCYRIFTFNF